MIKSSTLILFCGIQFILLGINSNLISSISPELIEYLKMNKFFINLMFSTPYFFSFIFTLILYEYFFKKRELSFYLRIGSLLFFFSNFIFCFIFFEFNSIVSLSFAILSKWLFGISLATMTTTLQILLNNRFCVNQTFLDNGIWSIILLFTQCGTMVSYFAAPYIFELSTTLFIAFCSAMSLLMYIITELIIGNFKNNLKMNNRESSIIPQHNIKNLIVIVSLITCLSTGIWISLLQYLPENITFELFDSQTLIAICILTGVLVAFVSWRFLSSSSYWFILSQLSIVLCMIGLTLIILTYWEIPMVLEIGVLCISIGSVILFSTPNIAAVNIFKGDDVRISFIWMMAFLYSSILIFSFLFNFLNSLPHGLNIICVFCIVIYGLCGFFISKLYKAKLKNIPDQDFNNQSIKLTTIKIPFFGFNVVVDSEHNETVVDDDTTA